MTITSYGPPWRINGPPPSPPARTLLGAARVVDDADAGGVMRWQGGAELYAYPSDIGIVWDACAPASEVTTKDEGSPPSHPQFAAMLVYLAETCSSMGIWGPTGDPQAAFVARAQATFGAIEAAAIEREFLAGDVLQDNPHLADGQGDFPNAATATSVLNALGILEDEIAASGRSGMIHMTPSIAIAASGQWMLYDDRGVLRTINGTPVVPGYGYASTYPGGKVHPDGKAAASGRAEWIYATGPVEIRRSELFVVPETVDEALDRETNTITYRAERYYLVTWDTDVQAAVIADPCMSTCS